MKKILLAIILIFALSYESLPQSSIIDSIKNLVNLDSLKLYVRQLSGDTACTIAGSPYTIVSRNKSQAGNNKAAEYIYEKFQRYGLNPQYETFSTTGYNVIGTKLGTQFPNRYYIVCAHFDDMPTGTTAPGADDNASGTAAVIEMARIFSKFNFSYTLKFMAFDEEEQGLIGSAYTATQARNRNDSIMGVINLDMIAYDGNNDGIINIHSKAVANTQQLAQDFADNIAQYGTGLVPVIVASQPYSDHDSFLNKNYGAILIIEDDNDFHPQYHTVNDKISYYNYSYFFKMSKTVAVTLAEYVGNYKIDLQHTQPFSYTNLTTPVTVQLNVFSGLVIGNGIQAPRCYYRINTGTGFGSWSYLTDINGPTGSLYEFTIPGQQLGTSVEYYFAAQDNTGAIVQTLPGGGGGINPPGSNPPSTLYSYAVANVTLALDDPADNMNHWLSQSLWGITTSSFVSPPSSFTDSPSGNYPSSTTNIMVLKDTINLENTIKAKITFQTKFDLESGYDYVQIQLSTNFGTTWIPLAGQYTKLGSGSFQPPNQPLYNGTQSTWVQENIEISAYLGQKVFIRFYFKSDGSLVKDGMYVDDFKVLIFKNNSTNVTANVSTNDGWNLLSIPLTMNDMSKSSLFPTSTSNAYGYNINYFISDSLNNGLGYWLKFNGSQNHQLSGIDLTTLVINGLQGWNLIGNINATVPVESISTNPAGLIGSNFYDYNGAYNQVASLEKGKGYWVKLNGAGQIQITKSSLKGGNNFTGNKYDNTLVIKDNTEKQKVLYLGDDNVNYQYSELPPLPPSNAFDIRFSDNKEASSYFKESVINFTGVTFPISVGLNSNENINIIVFDNTTGQELGIIDNNHPLIILNKTNSIKIISNTIPGDFQLYPNYPNPFNPITTIKYNIPSDGNVEINVYSSLGEKITNLVSENKKAGLHQVNFDGSNLSSGIYLVQIKFADKIKSIKATLLK